MKWRRGAFSWGDPKQSIYRFLRRADISTFLAAAQARFGADGGEVELTREFPDRGPVIEWVNATFEAPTTPRHSAFATFPTLLHRRPQPTRDRCSSGPPMCVLGRRTARQPALADDLRAAEADEVGSQIRADR